MASFWETIKVDGEDMNLYVSEPSGSGPFPGVVVIHAAELNQFTRDVADRLSGDGYAAVCPDLYHRITESMLADGSTPFNHLSDPEIVLDVDATVEFLRNHPSVLRDRVGITGFCVGGRVAYLAAATNSHIKAAVPYYGGNIMVPWGKATRNPFELTSQINCPILFHFGETDTNPSQSDMAKLNAELTRLGKSHQFFTYPGAGHAFMDHTGVRYEKAAAEASWPRTLEFFAAHLKGAAVA